MIIVVTARGKDENSSIDSRFGRCEYFIVYNEEEDSFRTVDNPAKNAAHGAGVQAAQTVTDLKPDVVITGNVGPRAFGGLNTAGIPVYSSGEGTVKEAISAYKEGNLEEVSSPTSERHSNI